MNLHEYQGKELLAKYGVRIQRGYIAHTVEESIQGAQKIYNDTNTPCFLVKAQVHAGGRGKGGGIKLAKDIHEVEKYANAILGMRLITPQTSKQGKIVHKVLICEDVYYPGEHEIEELYISVLLNRSTNRNMIMYSTEGGMEIEKVAEEYPNKIFTEEINPEKGLTLAQCQKIAINLNMKDRALDHMCTFLNNLYTSYVESDASLFEINPVIKASDNQIIAVDAKVTIDDNALFKHPEIEKYRDEKEEDSAELHASSLGLSYVKLDGNVGCVVNGAGLAMATMDIIKLSGGNPANFLDVGGTADAKRVESAFRIILEDKNVEAILVNIFGGIVRCDRVAQGVVDAYQNIESIEVPIIVRLQGTNATEAKEIIDNSGLKFISATSLQSAADAVKSVIGS
ncbi:MAG: ADP-forming succinate--CoA ligase subunit beta [Flavobacteriales bacterium]|nr:ADP-forming succinate--CoA ligase subunit beta [Flavobacteriales bacterium]